MWAWILTGALVVVCVVLAYGFIKNRAAALVLGVVLFRRGITLSEEEIESASRYAAKIMLRGKKEARKLTIDLRGKK